LNILLISATALPCPPPSYGGLEQVVYDLASELIKQHKVTVACPAESRLPPGVKHLKSNIWSAGDKDERLAFMRIQDKLKNYDIIHDHTHFKFFYYYIRDHPEAKYLATLHNPELTIQPEIYLNLVSPSKANSNYFYSKYGYRTKVIHHGIDTRKFKYSKTKEDYFLIMGRPQPIKGSLEAVRFCTPPDSIVSGNSISSINQKQVGEVVCGAIGKYPHNSRIKKIYRNYYDGPLQIIKVAYDSRPLKLTPKHPVYIRRVENGTVNYYWMPAYLVRKNDEVYLPIPKFRYCNKNKIKIIDYLRNIEYIEEEDYIYVKTSPSKVRIPKTFRLTELFCEFIGLYIAEGCTTEGKIIIGFHRNETKLISIVKKALEFITPTIKQRGNCIMLIYSNSILANFLSNLVGSSAKHKHLPDFYWKLSSKLRKALLRGIWLGDGYITNKQAILTTVSRTLANQVRTALLNLSILSGYYQDSKGAFRIYIPAGLLEEFYCSLGINQSVSSIRHTRRYRRRFYGYFVPVKSNKVSMYQGIVMNLETDSETFNINDILVHNCKELNVPCKVVAGGLEKDPDEYWSV